MKFIKIEQIIYLQEMYKKNFNLVDSQFWYLSGLILLQRRLNKTNFSQFYLYLLLDVFCGFQVIL